MTELEGLEHDREFVQAKIPEQPGAEIKPVVPSPGMISGMVRTVRRGTEPQVPVQAIGDWGRLRWPALPGRPTPEPCPTPYLNLPDLSERTIGNDLTRH